jgi:hypothetical protein
MNLYTVYRKPLLSTMWTPILEVEVPPDQTVDDVVYFQLRADRGDLDFTAIDGSHIYPWIEHTFGCSNGSICIAVPKKRYEWWQAKAEELGGRFEHHLGLPCVRTPDRVFQLHELVSGDGDEGGSTVTDQPDF